MEEIMLLTGKALYDEYLFNTWDIRRLMSIDDCDELSHRIEELWGLSVAPPDDYTPYALFSTPPDYTAPCLPGRLLFAGWMPLEVTTDTESHRLTALMRLDYKWTMLRLLQADSFRREDMKRMWDSQEWYGECRRIADLLRDMNRLSQPLQHSLENIGLCIQAFLQERDINDLRRFVAHDQSFALPAEASALYRLMRLCTRSERMLAMRSEQFPVRKAKALLQEMVNLCHQFTQNNHFPQHRQPAYVAKLAQWMANAIYLHTHGAHHVPADDDEAVREWEDEHREELLEEYDNMQTGIEWLRRLRELQGSIQRDFPQPIAESLPHRMTLFLQTELQYFEHHSTSYLPKQDKKPLVHRREDMSTNDFMLVDQALSLLDLSTNEYNRLHQAVHGMLNHFEQNPLTPRIRVGSKQLTKHVFYFIYLIDPRKRITQTQWANFIVNTFDYQASVDSISRNLAQNLDNTLTNIKHTHSGLYQAVKRLLK